MLRGVEFALREHRIDALATGGIKGIHQGFGRGDFAAVGVDLPVPLIQQQTAFVRVQVGGHQVANQLVRRAREEPAGRIQQVVGGQVHIIKIYQRYALRLQPTPRRFHRAGVVRQVFGAGLDGLGLGKNPKRQPRTQGNGGERGGKSQHE